MRFAQVMHSLYAHLGSGTAAERSALAWFQHAVEMLGSSVPAIRVTGLNALRRLAAEYPDSYGDRVEELFDVLRQFPIEDEHDHD